MMGTYHRARKLPQRERQLPSQWGDMCAPRLGLQEASSLSRRIRVYCDDETTLRTHLGSTSADIREAPDGEESSLTDALEPRLLTMLFEDCDTREFQVDGRAAHLNSVAVVSRPRRSQFDLMAEALRRRLAVPHGLVCLGGSSEAFRGHHGRGWAALRGNLHLTVAFRPQRPIEHFGPGALALGALACVDAVDTLTGGTVPSGIHWVNDVVSGDRKLAGVLTWSQLQGGRVDALLLGIGLNVLSLPVGVQDAAVRAATCLAQLVPDVTLAQATAALGAALDRRYSQLLTEGGRPLVEDYRRRLTLIGRRVRHVSDLAAPVSPAREGTVRALGDGLELWLEGHGSPLVEGRVALLD